MKKIMKTLEAIESEDNAHLEELTKIRKPATCPLKTFKISEDITVSVTDNIKNLYRNNEMKFPRRINIEIPEQSESITIPLTRYPRKCKSKVTSSILINDDDDDQLEDEFPSVLHPSARLRSSNKTSETITSTSTRNGWKKDLSNENDTLGETPPKKQRSNLENFFGNGFKKLSSFVIPKLSERTSTTFKNTNESAMKKEPKKGVECPMCSVVFSENEIHEHAAECQGPKNTRQRNPGIKESEVFNQSLWNTEVNNLNGETTEKSNNQTNTNKTNDSSSCFSSEVKPTTFYPHITNINGINKSNMASKTTGTEYGSRHTNTKDTELTSKDHIFLSDDEDDIFQQYAKTNNNAARKPIPRAFGRNNFDESDNSDPLGSEEKCFRCNKMFPTRDGIFGKHSKECLNESKQDTSIIF